MEIQTPELAVEAILQVHRDWITTMYVEEKRTVHEIVALLDEYRIFVT